MSIPLLLVVMFHSLCCFVPKLPTTDDAPATGIGSLPLFEAKSLDRLKLSVEAVLERDSILGDALLLGLASFSFTASVSSILSVSFSDSARLAASANLKASASRDRKSTRLNSSHVRSSYAVFCL